MNALQIKLERLELMLVDDGYNDTNIIYQTLKELQELAIDNTRSSTELPSTLEMNNQTEIEAEELINKHLDKLNANNIIGKDGNIYKGFLNAVNEALISKNNI